MARTVRLTATGPHRIDPATIAPGKMISICVCGLSQNYPICDGSHKITRAEEPGVLYTYSADAKAVIAQRPDDQYQPPAAAAPADQTPPIAGS
jgi:CDGSH-type Zn-finger protein